MPDDLNILDLLNLDGHVTAALDDEAQVTLFGLAEDYRLSVEASARLSNFLDRNRHHFAERLGGQVSSRRIYVWRANHARNILFQMRDQEFLLAVEARSGLLFPFNNYDRVYHYVGFSHDQRLAVLVPGDLYAAYLRECKIAHVAQQLQSSDPHVVAIGVEALEEAHDPDNGYPSLALEAAEAEARSVAYWLEVAGPIPRGNDPYDGRRPPAQSRQHPRKHMFR